MPKPKRLFLFVLMVFVVLIPTSVFAQHSPRIFVVKTLDYPGVGNSTTPFGINDRGDIAGDYVDSSNVRRGFVRFGNGTFSPPIVEPGDTGSFTRARGINDGRTVTGDFANGIFFHGYLLRNGVFTQFDVGPTVSTGIFGINDRGNFVGAAGNSVTLNRPFINVGEPPLLLLFRERLMVRQSASTIVIAWWVHTAMPYCATTVSSEVRVVR